MSIAKWCVLAACLLPIATVALAKVKAARLSRKNGGYDNNNPREWQSKLSGWQQRANAAQANGFEALPLFIAGVVFAQMAQADQSRIDLLAMAFVGIRVAYVAAYLANLGTLRSLIWCAGVGVCIALLAMGT
ncbi:MAG: glutathione metabolism protein [Burkholderiales bacterium PBB3]|nr:MAG: glutathione metabolism protein [Burkholderiales bacterium PBB3]